MGPPDHVASSPLLDSHKLYTSTGACWGRCKAPGGRHRPPRAPSRRSARSSASAHCRCPWWSGSPDAAGCAERSPRRGGLRGRSLVQPTEGWDAAVGGRDASRQCEREWALPGLANAGFHAAATCIAAAACQTPTALCVPQRLVPHACNMSGRAGKPAAAHPSPRQNAALPDRLISTCRVPHARPALHGRAPQGEGSQECFAGLLLLRRPPSCRRRARRRARGLQKGTCEPRRRRRVGGPPMLRHATLGMAAPQHPALPEDCSCRACPHTQPQTEAAPLEGGESSSGSGSWGAFLACGGGASRGRHGGSIPPACPHADACARPRCCCACPARCRAWHDAQTAGEQPKQGGKGAI